ncbi:PREDICTED: cytochrome P450 18a1-like [Priapulus caudatus]|uniref:Cytochrome P450 18a1-like n=1 Tax=Priapulus caudatus TaxID=37621 RepID=A0ABM1EQ03_PRICU|nr:PREDICTED: cytochrome P450 18a1-like [Priapulus caudatus]XP_014674275.1 PREDICTED: cytochrome P450 18a1-like [Priapulus caudatus]
MLSLLLLLFLIFLAAVWLLDQRRVSHGNLPPSVGFRFPVVGHLPYLSRDAHIDFARWGEKYGKLLHLWMGEKLVVVVNDYELIKEAFKREEFSGRPDMFLFNVTSENRTRGVILTEGAIWKYNRRFCLSSLRDMGMGRSSLESKILDEIDILLAAIEEKKQRAFDFSRLLDASIANVIGKVIFNQHFGYDDAEFTGVIASIQTNIRIVGSAFALNFLPFLRIFSRLTRLSTVMENQEWHETYFMDHIKKHREAFHDGRVNDFIDAHLLQQESCSKQPEQDAGPDVFNDIQLRALIGELFSAGTDTTTTTLSWGLLYMMLHPHIQQHIQKEIDEQVGDNKRPSMSDMPKMPYTAATILEIQRMANVVPLGVMHANNAGPAELGGYTIPAGTTIFPNLYAVHTDPKLWPEPAAFRPERFLSLDGKVLIPEGFVPFSVGKRKCLGESLAKMELFLFFTCLLQKFSFQLPDGAAQPDMKGVLGITLTPKPYKLCAIRRS